MAKLKPKTRAGFFKLERATWEQLNKPARGLPASAWKLPGASGEWSLKDVWAHIAAWMRETRRVMPLILKAKKFPVDIQGFNRVHHARDERLGVSSARRRAESERKRLLAMIRKLDEKTLLKNRRVYTWASYSTYNHYAEHIPALRRFRRAFLRKQK